MAYMSEFELLLSKLVGELHMFLDSLVMKKLNWLFLSGWRTEATGCRERNRSRTTTEARNLEYDCPPTLKPREKECQHVSTQVHIPTFWSLL